MKYIYPVATLLFCYAMHGCTKTESTGLTPKTTQDPRPAPAPDAVDTIVGNYYGIKYEFHSFTGRYPSTYYTEHDTSFESSVSIIKVGHDSFKIVNNIPTYSYTFYNSIYYSGNKYEDYSTTLEFHPINDSISIRSYYSSGGGTGTENFRHTFNGKRK
jgi:hypothetical protein